MTMVSWLIDTSRPRMAAGATSAMYIGERLDASADGHAAEHAPGDEERESWAPSALPSDVAANRSAADDQQPLAAEAVAQRAGESAPTRQPSSAQLFAQPLCRRARPGRSSVRKTAWRRR